jgi:hypothetical protein
LGWTSIAGKDAWVGLEAGAARGSVAVPRSRRRPRLAAAVGARAHRIDEARCVAGWLFKDVLLVCRSREEEGLGPPMALAIREVNRPTAGPAAAPSTAVVAGGDEAYRR